ncbi:hypothetical protein OIE78_34640 (plasmid) [Streptomyces cellulosae]|uniref:hypothetical protein n=1 Tax=Streptomyces cellulosae TaxID=1968 RepID=UPI002F90F076|nr:hypothetical protein OG837_35575 [Streptomyces cellulosae]
MPGRYAFHATTPAGARAGHTPPAEPPVTAVLELGPLPFGGDRARWDRERRIAARRHVQALADHPDLSFNALRHLTQPLESTGSGWIRWDCPPGHSELEDAYPAEIGVFAPLRIGGWRTFLARAVWGRQPAPRVRRVNGWELPVSLSAARLGGFVLTLVFAGPLLARHVPGGHGLLWAAVCGIALAWGVPAAVAAATRRQVRIVGGDVPELFRICRLLAAQQMIARAAAAAPGPELERAHALGHRYLWDAVGLVAAAAEGHSEAPALLKAYEDSYRHLAVSAATAVRSRTLLEADLCRDARPRPRRGPGRGLYQGTRQERLVQQAAPVEVLDDVADELASLAAGLRYARTADPAAVVLWAGESRA